MASQTPSPSSAPASTDASRAAPRDVATPTPRPVPSADPDIAGLRRDYQMASLDESDVDPDPLRQFQRWFDDAVNAQLQEANAMAVASVDADGRPSCRVLLLKGIEQGGFVFFTNYASRKGREFAANPFAALTFLWYPIERQVRVEGRIERIAAHESDAYYKVRPLGSRIGAWASPQSEVIASRQILEENQARYEKQLGENPPRPEHWGGYRVMPEMIEFWQGRRSRLHDRIRYRRPADQAQAGQWIVDRLAA